MQTGFAAYRATVDTKLMQDDPDISWLLMEPSLNIWYVPKSCVPRQKRSSFNIQQDRR
jgi:hypothetical protein